MKPITKEDKNIALEILLSAYIDNPGTNLIVGRTRHKKARLHYLLKYALCKSMLHNGAFISEDKAGVVLILYPKRSYFTFKLLCMEVVLLFYVIGFIRIFAVLKREKLLKSNHFELNDYCHLWFLAVKPAFQKKGIAAAMLNELKNMTAHDNKNIIVETVEQAEYYIRHGFKKYKTVDNSVLNYSFLRLQN